MELITGDSGFPFTHIYDEYAEHVIECSGIPCHPMSWHDWLVYQEGIAKGRLLAKWKVF